MTNENKARHVLAREIISSTILIDWVMIQALHTPHDATLLIVLSQVAEAGLVTRLNESLQQRNACPNCSKLLLLQVLEA